MPRPELPYRLVDADHPCYEPDDCCTRHSEANYRERAIHIETLPDGAREWRFGDKPLSFHRGARDFTISPGALRAYYEGKEFDGESAPVVSTDRPAYRDRKARLATMDKQSIEASIMYPSFGVAIESDMRGDPEAAVANVRAFNRFIEEDWGFAYENRIFAPPLLSLVDLYGACREADRVLSAGARLVAMSPGILTGRSPADPYYDPFWARLNEAQVPVVLHIGVSSYMQDWGTLWGEPAGVTETEMSAFQYLTCFGERPMVDMMAALVLHNLFGRHPNLQVVSIENGSKWVPALLANMDRAAAASISTKGEASGRWLGGPLKEMPSEIFCKHVYVSPFWEDHVHGLVDVIGSQRVLFGSDWPHPEGTAQPLDFLSEVEGLPDEQVRHIMRSNTADLLGLER
jgi:predicted TIM-barrel fold metal-dependent hydrolase